MGNLPPAGQDSTRNANGNPSMLHGKRQRHGWKFHVKTRLCAKGKPMKHYAVCFQIHSQKGELYAKKKKSW